MGDARRWLVSSAAIAFASSPRLRGRPHRAYAALRRIDPVHQSPIGFWLLSTHQDVTALLRHPDVGNDESKADLAALRLGPLGWLARSGGDHAVPDQSDLPSTRMMTRLMLFRDPPDHTRLRSLVNKAFTPRAIAALEERITEIAHRRIDAVAAAGRMDFLADFAYPLPALVICELMGVPAADHTLIARHAPALAARLDPSPLSSAAVIAAADRATEELSGYLDGVISGRRRDPGDDILSRLLEAGEDGDRLSHEELVAMAVLLLIAGHETTANLLGNGLLALMRAPEQWSRFRTEPALERSCVEELLRFDGPIQMVERIARSDLDTGRVAVPRGRIVVLCLAAANRDPAVFDRPDRLDIGRDPNPHLAFGAGVHFCLGASLARLEARVALRVVADRLPGLRLLEARPPWRPSFTIRGLKRLPVAW